MKVKTLKDLPDLPAGTIFEDDGKSGEFAVKYEKYGKEMRWVLSRDTIIANRDWFEEVKE